MASEPVEWASAVRGGEIPRDTLLPHATDTSAFERHFIKTVGVSARTGKPSRAVNGENSLYLG